MKKGTFISLFFFSLFFIFSPFVHAARTLVITVDKTALFGEEELIVLASPSGFASTEKVYLKGAFYQEDSTNYFGYTKYSENWIKNSVTALDQPSYTINTWDRKLSIKNDYQDSGFMGEGYYKFKVGFYYLTSGGNISPINWSNVLEVKLKPPDPTPTPTATPFPTPTRTPSPSPTPTLIPIKTPLPARTPTSHSTPTPLLSLTEEEASVEAVLGETALPDLPHTPTPEVIHVKSASDTNLPPLFSILFMSVGGLFLLSCGIIIYRNWRLNQ